MDDRDEWLEGVRRWYFGGDAPPEMAASDDGIVWPGAAQTPCNKTTPCADCGRRRVSPAVVSAPAGAEARL